MWNMVHQYFNLEGTKPWEMAGHVDVRNRVRLVTLSVKCINGDPIAHSNENSPGDMNTVDDWAFSVTLLSEILPIWTACWSR